MACAAVLLALLLVPAARGAGHGWGATPLLTAAFQREDARALALIRGGVDVDEANTDGETPLMYAGLWGDERIQEALLAAGADVSKRDGYGQSPLYYAVVFNHASARQVQALIAAGADLEAPGIPYRYTPLMAAVNRCRPDLVGLLLKAGATVDRTSGLGRTPLLEAAVLGCLPAARLLLEAGADPRRRDKYGRTATELAAAARKPALVRLLAAAAKR